MLFTDSSSVQYNLLPVVAFSQSTAYSANEGDGTSNAITISRTGVTTSTSSVIVSITGGTAAGSTDYTATGFPKTISFAANETSKTVAVSITDDAIYETSTPETITFSLGTPTGATIGSQSTATLNIVDNENQPAATLELSGSPLAENAGQATVTAKLNRASTENITVNLSLSGTATGSGTDYTPSASAITINAGSTSGSITLTGVNDSIDDDNETIIIDIDSVTNGTESGTQQVTATITDDDESYSISIAKTTDGAENNGSTPTDAVFTVTVTPANASGAAITGNIAYSGTATNGTDYATGATTFSIPNNSSTATITLDVTEDAIVEGTETATATISSPSTGSIGTASATANLTDDESYSISIAKTTDGAENNGSTPTDAVFTVTVTPANASGAAITGNIAYSGTATNGTDYATGATTFSIPNNSSTATITLDVTEDAIVEGTETIIGTISGASAGSISTAAATANLTDDESASINVSAISGNTGESGKQATFTVVLNSQPTADVTIALSSDDASEGTVSPSSLTFTAANWDSPQTVTITGVDDNEVDGDQTYTIVTAAAVSNDFDYSGINANDVSVINTDLGSDVPEDAVDTDPVSDTNEQGPAGTDTTYDGNGDGQSDKTQSDVVSMHINSGANYATFVLEQNYNDLTTVKDVANPSASNVPSGVTFPLGFFDIDLPTNGSTAQIVIHIPEGVTMPTHYYKYDPANNEWYDFAYDGMTGAVFAGRTITLHFKDGERGDIDGSDSNGQINDPGGPVVFNTGGGAGSGGVQNIPVFGPFGVLAMLLSLLWFGNRRRNT